MNLSMWANKDLQKANVNISYHVDKSDFELLCTVHIRKLFASLFLSKGI